MRLIGVLLAGMLGSPALAAAPAVDPFGQPVRGAWPDKITTEAELRADVAADEAYYGSLQPPARDRFGGLPGSRERLGLTATGFFRVEKRGDRWLLVDPDGNAFFHLGVCGMSPGDTYTVTRGREGDFAWLPPADGPYRTAHRPQPPGIFSFYLANMIRKYGRPYDPAEFEARVIGRIRTWGFNSVGAFSPILPAVQAAGIPYVTHLPLDPSVGIPFLPGIAGTWDPFEEANRAKIDQIFAKSVAARADDPLLIGWFLANEPLYEDLPKVVPALKGDHACKRALVDLLRKKYGTIAACNAAWGLAAGSFDALADLPLAVATRAASEDVRAFTALFYETYYRLVAETFHRYDAHHLLLGNRLQPGTINDEALCRAAGKYLDVMSFNYYTDALDGAFLKRIYGWTGRPLMLSEFYWASGRDSGLSGGRAVASQRERGLAYRNYVEQAAALGFVVGTEWFQLIDEAADGRWFEGPGGERANCGLLSVTDRPWKEMLAEMTKTNDGIYDVWLGGRKPFVFDQPRFSAAGTVARSTSIPRATGPIALDGASAHWPGVPPEIVSGGRISSGVEADGLGATFKLCWDDACLYVLAHVADPTPLKNLQGPRALWNGDAVEIFVGAEAVDADGPLRFGDRHFLLGAAGPGAAPAFEAVTGQAADLASRVVPAPDGYTLEAAIPWKSLGLAPRPGLAFRFDLGIDDSADGRNRRAQLMWSGTDKNSGDRTHWGRATLLP